MPRKITEHIHAVCKENGIKYTSQYDVKRLGELIMELRAIADEVNCILERHEIDANIRVSIGDFLASLGGLNHGLSAVAKEIKDHD